MKLKQCAGCSEKWPPDTEFYASESSTRCIACEKERPVWSKYRSEESIERRRAQQREYRRLQTVKKKASAGKEQQ